MLYLYSFLLGVCFGSFGNVCILRLPNEESLQLPRSHCPRCKTPLKNIHNIPLISFIALKGRCSFCAKAISWQYPLVELTLGLLFLFHAYFFAYSFGRMILADVLGFYLLVISVIDYRHRIIPDELSLSLAAIGLAGSFFNVYLAGTPTMRFLQSLLSGLGGGLLMYAMAYVGEKAFKKEALGGGDIKLVAAAGAVLGWKGVLGSLFIGSLLGGAGAFVLILMKKKKLGETLPFGPFLALGIYVSCLFPGLCAAFFSPVP